MFEINSEVLRKTGNSQKGIVQAVRGTLVQVAWQNAVNRINGNKVTRTWVKADRLIPYNENTAAFRARATNIRHTEHNMKLYYGLMERSTEEKSKTHNRASLEKQVARYNQLMNSDGDYSYGVCGVCERERVLDKGICDGCGKRRARATNTREMYGKSRRGY